MEKAKEKVVLLPLCILLPGKETENQQEMLLFVSWDLSETSHLNWIVKMHFGKRDLLEDEKLVSRTGREFFSVPKMLLGTAALGLLAGVAPAPPLMASLVPVRAAPPFAVGSQSPSKAAFHIV